MQQESLFSSDSPQQDQVAGPVTCLGKTFANDQARRDYFLALLAEKLKDPEFRKIEGFPIGSDEDILNLSDPPYYTACPNPWVANFITMWEDNKPKQLEASKYLREPFAADVSEGKYDPVYRMHPYHTKVPHKAIMRYILHYTQPGDIVLDGFGGTGMTGVAAQMCGNRDEVISLGYKVGHDDLIFKEEDDSNGNKTWRPFSKLGTRKVLLNDLSPIATFIGYNYNTSVNTSQLDSNYNRIMVEVEKQCGWMFETKHTDGRIGKIEYIIWSDVYSCPECAEEIVFWKTAVDILGGKVMSDFPCPECSSVLTKRNLEKKYVTVYDKSLNTPKKFAKQIPVLINYSIGTQRFSKEPDDYDLDLIDKIESMDITCVHPVEPLPEGVNTAQPIKSHGFDHVHHFYTRRNLAVLAAFKEKANLSELSSLTAVALRITKRYGLTYQSGVWGAGGGPTNGTYYIPALIKELNMINMLEAAIKKQVEAKKGLCFEKGNSVIGVQSLESLRCNDEVIDYIFIDPPFGSNLNYSELNFLWESWLGVWMNNRSEAIENKVQGKGINEYRKLMTSCFQQAYRVLKPGRWITIEFSNTSAVVWNNIQTALLDAGFIVANVSALDKQKGSFKALTTPTAVKQDLVISAYKPTKDFEQRLEKEAQSEEGVWDFVRTHLEYLPVIKQQGSQLQFVPERDPRILFDQMVAYYVRKSYPVPISSLEFQRGLAQRFVERHGMFFLPEQALEYDLKKMVSGEYTQISMFVCDEASAIQWLHRLLKEKPQTFSDINPEFMQKLGGWSKNEIVLDLRELLSQNFLCYDGQDDIPDQIHSYLSSNWKELHNLAKNDPALVAKAKDRWYVPDPNKAGDLEKLREKSLLKEFEEYKAAKKKLKVFRIEAVRVGFKKLWEQQEFAALIAVAEKLPNSVLEEDPVLLMYYDQAITLSQVDADDEW
ncbi:MULTISPECIES: DNA methyltransferase [Aeromonas]|uniref:DNA methyltransferase n=1 Tax=Aeromonas TaxID=642 RepID=UPI000665A748|nr:DNA methyltransferase [Aeromonas hydrophila]MBF4800026.1 site-specific DNA-methyltransferase [Aeromonas hydrophila]